MLGKLYNYLTMLGSRDKDIPCSEGDCINDDSKSSHIEPHVESESVPKDIAEPVISFLKCWKKNPRRFKLFSVGSCPKTRRGINGIIYTTDEICYGLKDRFTNQHFYYEGGWPKDDWTIVTDVINETEYLLIYETLKEYYSARWWKKVGILCIRYNRRVKNERKRLTEIYKED